MKTLQVTVNYYNPETNTYYVTGSDYDLYHWPMHSNTIKFVAGDVLTIPVTQLKKVSG